MARKNYEGIPAYARDYLMYLLSIRALSEKTVDQYYLDLRIFFRFFTQIEGLTSEPDFEKIDASAYPLENLKKLTLSDLYAYLNFAVRERENEARTRARKISSLRSFFKYLKRNALLDDNPTLMLEAPKERRHLPVYLTAEEAVRLLDSVKKGPNQARDFCILTLFLNCGLRLSELTGINLTNINGRTLRVLGKGGKERMLYLNDACMDALSAYLEVRKSVHPDPGSENALFISRNGKRISNRMIELTLEKYLRAAGLDAEKYSPHKLRHTAATLMHQNGVDVRVLQEVLGHANLGTTQIYTHLENSEVETALRDNPLSKYKKT